MWGMLRWGGGGGQSRSPMRLAAAVSCRGRDRSCRGLPQRRYTRGGCSYVVAASSACRLVPCCRRPERSAAVSAALVIGMTRTSPLPWPPPRAHVRRPCHGAGRAVTRIGHGRYGTSSGCRAAVAIGTTRTLSPRPSPRGVSLLPCGARWRTPRVLRSEDDRNDPYIDIAAASPAGACCGSCDCCTCSGDIPRVLAAVRFTARGRALGEYRSRLHRLLCSCYSPRRPPSATGTNELRAQSGLQLSISLRICIIYIIYIFLYKRCLSMCTQRRTLRCFCTLFLKIPVF